MHCVKPTNAKPEVQAFGHELPWPPHLDGHRVKPPKAQSRVQERERKREDVKFPLQTFRGKNIRIGVAARLENQDFLDLTQIVGRPPTQLQKNYCPCILEGHLSTNPILSAIHIQGLESKIYVFTFIK
jgi:hypothetical protein